MSTFKITVEQLSPPLIFIYTLELSSDWIEELNPSKEIDSGDFWREARRNAQGLARSLGIIDPKITIEKTSEDFSL